MRQTIAAGFIGIAGSLLLGAGAASAQGEPGRGFKLVYVDGSESGKDSLALYDPATGRTTRLTQAFPLITTPSYNAKTGEIGFNVYERSLDATVSCVLPSPGAKPKRAFERKRIEAFSPDGSSLLLTTSGSLDEHALILYSLADKKETLVPEATDVFRACFSPDGGRIAFQRGLGGDSSRLFVYSAATRKVQELPNSPGGLKQLCSFTPDGKKLLCQVSSGGSWTVAFLDVATGKYSVTKIRGANPALSPDGQFIAYQTDEKEEKVVIAKADGSSPVVVGRGGQPLWIK